MSELPPDLEKIEDVYEPYLFLGDYLNRLAAAPVDAGELMRDVDEKTGDYPKVISVEEHFKQAQESREKIYAEHPAFREKNKEKDAKFLSDVENALNDHPQKIAALNMLADIINNTEDPNTIMQAHNKMVQLVRGKDAALTYDEPEADPENITLEAK